MADLAGSTVLLAGDQAIVQEAFAALCEANGMRIVGQCTDGPLAVQTILAKQPDFAIFDLEMPGVTAIELIRSLRSAGCPAKIVILSSSRKDKDAIGAFAAGANAYLLKDGPARHFLEAISYVREGGQYVSPLLKGAGLFTKAGANALEDPLRTESRIAKLLPRWRRRR